MTESTNKKAENKKKSLTNENELFDNKPVKEDEIESDGSANAFDETESVNEDNFDHLSEK